MNIVLFYHSLVSDWNHGNAHFLRGIFTELLSRGHKVTLYEPKNAWSRENLEKDYGTAYKSEFARYYPSLSYKSYSGSGPDLNEALAEAELVLVHEWNDHQLVADIGKYRQQHQHFKLLFHDTHHRAVTQPEQMAGYNLQHYDGVLAFGKVISNIYRQKGWAKNVFTWHEAADTNIFKPIEAEKELDLVWVGNWGDNERTAELHHFLIEPVQELGLKAAIYGVRYPNHALEALDKAGIIYRGYLPNYKAPEAFAKARLTVHVPRGPYVQALPGIPTIRPFEALACKLPLVSAPWQDAEKLFRPGTDFVYANNKSEMLQQLERLLSHPEQAQQQAEAGYETIVQRHTCKHRVEELMRVVEVLK